MLKAFLLVIAGCCLLFISTLKSYGQVELQAWGNITGIRIQGELMGFESSLRVVGNQWTSVTATGKERQSPKFYRDSTGRQIVNTRLGSISLTETVTDLSAGKAVVRIKYLSASDTSITGIFFCIRISLKDYGSGNLRFDKGSLKPLAGIKPDSSGEVFSIQARNLSIESAERQIQIEGQEKEMVIVRTKFNDPFLEIYFPLQTGKLKAGEQAEKSFIIHTSGNIDKKDIHLVLDTTRPGMPFAGFGGNFRIQNLKNDPAIIDYCLANMRVAWGRVEMPWRFWQPEKTVDPILAAKAGRTDAHVVRAMEMAQKLQQRGIPIILSAWFPPQWAVEGKLRLFHQPGETWGNALNPDSALSIYQSIADYIQYLKDQYGVHIRFFSFNESDLGINVRQTASEHNELIKGLGKYFQSRGLETQMLLGDNSDATTYSFIETAMLDSAALPYIGAISFHSWRGWETELLSKWAAASREINRPLIIGEGSIDAAAWAYPAIFLEQTYTMEEINLYIRLMAICQPMTILQWQLTSDYSPVSGGGVLGKEGALQPTQRFWNLKQLASTPEGLAYLPVSSDRNAITCAALGNTLSGKYVLHLVNNGAERKVIFSSLPAGIRSFKVFSTGKNRSMLEAESIKVKHGEAIFKIIAGTYYTLISN